MLKKLLIVPLLLVVFAVFFLGGVYVWWSQNSKAPSTNSQEVAFLITRGKGASEVAQDLRGEGLVKSPLAFKIYVQMKGYSDRIQAGRYSIPQNLTVQEVAELLIKGPKDIWVTVPEGLRREEIVEKFIEGLGKEGQDASIFRQEFLAASEGVEGFLFPDTYLFPREVRAQSIVSAMRNTFDKRIEEIGGDKSPELTLEGVVTLASIIERETKTDLERPLVAGILLNRLDIGMALQVDAATQYAIANVKCQNSNVKCDNWWPILTREDLQIDSPYNTYKYRGLPPAPIANPGKSSLEAVVNPQQTDYFYYLHDSEGNIYYAESLDEHNENVRLYLNK